MRGRNDYKEWRHTLFRRRIRLDPQDLIQIGGHGGGRYETRGIRPAEAPPPRTFGPGNHVRSPTTQEWNMKRLSASAHHPSSSAKDVCKPGRPGYAPMFHRTDCFPLNSAGFGSLFQIRTAQHGSRNQQAPGRC